MAESAVTNQIISLEIEAYAHLRIGNQCSRYAHVTICGSLSGKMVLSDDVLFDAFDLGAFFLYADMSYLMRNSRRTAPSTWIRCALYNNDDATPVFAITTSSDQSASFEIQRGSSNIRYLAILAELADWCNKPPDYRDYDPEIPDRNQFVYRDPQDASIQIQNTVQDRRPPTVPGSDSIVSVLADLRHRNGENFGTITLKTAESKIVFPCALLPACHELSKDSYASRWITTWLEIDRKMIVFSMDVDPGLLEYKMHLRMPRAGRNAKILEQLAEIREWCDSNSPEAPDLEIEYLPIKIRFDSDDSRDYS